MQKRIVSIWFPRLPTDRLARVSGSAWRDEPAATVARSGNRAFVAAANAPAAGAGLFAGMPLADGRALVPALHLAPVDPEADAAALLALARWAERYTPWAAVDGADGLFLDISGAAHLFGGEAAMLADIGRRFAAMGLDCRAALAATPGAAWAIARFGRREAIVASGAERAALVPLPVAALRLEAAILADLAPLGLKSVGDVVRLPRASLVARFGRSLIARLDQAHGLIEEPISPLRPVAPHRVRLAFAEPIGKAEDIAAALDRLLAALCDGLAREEQGGRRFELILFRIDHTTQRLAVGTGLALRDPKRLKWLFADKLERLDPGFGIECLLLQANAVEPLDAAQILLVERTAAADPAGRGPEALADLIDRLSNRLGAARVVRFAPLASHMPERSFRSLPAAGARGLPWTRTSSGPARPLRLLSRPERLEALALAADTAADVPPARFLWRRRPHALCRAQGPERILPEWWQGDGAWNGEPRDYWRVEDEDGAQLWLFREAGADARPPRWFVHGVFS